MFYDLLLPLLRMLGPTRGDAILGWLGRVAMAVRPRRRQRFRACTRARQCRPRCRLVDRDHMAGAGVEHGAVPGPRLPARSPVRRGRPESVRRTRLRAAGRDALRPAAAPSWSAVTWGPTSPGVHWLFRRGVPLRLLVQRPRHVSRELNRRFDARGQHPQAEMFLRRDLSPAVAVERVFRARAALRDGLAIYLNGDIPWTGPNTCAGRLLGRPQRFLAIWTELAVLTNAPVFLVFCTHLPDGRFALEIEAIGHLHAGEEESAIADYLKQLEARIVASPADASRAPRVAVLCITPRAAPQSSRRRRDRHPKMTPEIDGDRPEATAADSLGVGSGETMTGCGGMGQPGMASDRPGRGPL